MWKIKTFDEYWKGQEERYQKFLSRAKSRRTKVCHGICEKDRESVENQLAKVTVRIKDNLPN